MGLLYAQVSTYQLEALLKWESWHVPMPVRKSFCICIAMEGHDAQEVQIMQQCSFDRNIVQFYGFCPSPPMLVLEFMEVR